jgi:hypothetical protein
MFAKTPETFLVRFLKESKTMTIDSRDYYASEIERYREEQDRCYRTIVEDELLDCPEKQKEVSAILDTARWMRQVIESLPAYPSEEQLKRAVERLRDIALADKIGNRYYS